MSPASLQQMDDDAKRPAVLLQHPCAPIRLVEQALDSLQRAKKAQRRQRVDYLARLFAGWEDITIDAAPAQIKAAYIRKAIRAYDDPIEGVTL